MRGLLIAKPGLSFFAVPALAAAALGAHNAAIYLSTTDAAVPSFDNLTPTYAAVSSTALMRAASGARRSRAWPLLSAPKFSSQADPSVRLPPRSSDWRA